MFKILGDPTRLKIVEGIIHQERNGKEIEDYLLSQGIDIQQPSISHHIKQLLRSHLIEYRQYGTYRYYYCPCPELLMGMIALARALISLAREEIRP